MKNTVEELEVLLAKKDREIERLKGEWFDFSQKQRQRIHELEAEIIELKQRCEEAETDQDVVAESLANYADGIDMKCVVQILNATREKSKAKDREIDRLKGESRINELSNDVAQDKIAELEAENARLRDLCEVYVPKGELK